MAQLDLEASDTKLVQYCLGGGTLIIQGKLLHSDFTNNVRAFLVTISLFLRKSKHLVLGSCVLVSWVMYLLSDH